MRDRDRDVEIQKEKERMGGNRRGVTRNERYSETGGESHMDVLKDEKMRLQRWAGGDHPRSRSHLL